MRHIPFEVPPTDDIPLKEWLSRMIIMQNASISDIYDTIFGLDLEVILKSASSVVQDPVGLDIPMQISYGTPIEINDEILELSPSGSITFKKKGQAIAFITLSIGRMGNPMASYLNLHIEKNGFASDFSITSSLEGALQYNPLYATFEMDAEVGDVFDGFLTRDSSGVDDGGLSPFTPVNPSVPPTPSARIVIKKILQ